MKSLTLTRTDGTPIALSPTFAKDTTAYTVSVPNAVTRVTVAAESDVSYSTVTLPPDVDRNLEGIQVDLQEGANAIDVVVDPEDTATSTKTYTVTISRNGAATGKPSIAGTARVGQTLTASAGTMADVNGLPSAFTYQWIRTEDGTDSEIANADSSTQRVTGRPERATTTRRPPGR